MSLAPIEHKPERLADLVYAAIRNAITGKQLLPGERVTEAGLAKRLNVSKTPVREALLRLQEVGLIEPDPVRGSRVVRPSPVAFDHAYELREVLESFAAEKAALQASPDEVRAIRDAARRSLQYAKAGQLDDFRAWDRTFHNAIVQAARNPRATKAIEEACALIGAIHDRDLPHADAAVACGNAHVELAETIGRHDSDGAATQARAHVHQMRDFAAVSDVPQTAR